MIVPWRPNLREGLEVLKRALMFITGLKPRADKSKWMRDLQ